MSWVGGQADNYDIHYMMTVYDNYVAQAVVIFPPIQISHSYLKRKCDVIAALVCSVHFARDQYR